MAVVSTWTRHVVALAAVVIGTGACANATVVEVAVARPTPTPVTAIPTPDAVQEETIVATRVPVAVEPVATSVPVVDPTVKGVATPAQAPTRSTVNIAGSGPPGPVATVAPSTSTGGVRWSYSAILGSLGPDDLVVAPVTAPPPAPGGAPLTGIAATAPLGRAVVIKIDNANAARPQSGLNVADIVYEEMVEDGITRLAAVFHSRGSATVGPVRSGRSTDIGLIGSFREPVFANSGANSIFDGLLDKQPIVNRGAELYGGYWRSSGRSAPHNLFTATDTLLSGLGPSAPPAHYAYRDAGQSPPASAPTATSVDLTYAPGSAPVAYRWDAAVGGWRRWQSGSAHVDANGVQVAPENLIVQFVDYVDTGMTDKFGSVIVEGTLVGSGVALVFTDGRVLEGTWTRATLRTPTSFTDDTGAHIELSRGRTWVALVPPNGARWS